MFGIFGYMTSYEGVTFGAQTITQYGEVSAHSVHGFPMAETAYVHIVWDRPCGGASNAHAYRTLRETFPVLDTCTIGH